jgi:hypothetical protein
MGSGNLANVFKQRIEVYNDICKSNFIRGKIDKFLTVAVIWHARNYT